MVKISVGNSFYTKQPLSSCSNFSPVKCEEMGENAACYKRGEDFCRHLKYKRMPWSVALIGLCDDKSLRVTRSDSVLYGYDRDIGASPCWIRADFETINGFYFWVCVVHDWIIFTITASILTIGFTMLLPRVIFYFQSFLPTWFPENVASPGSFQGMG